MPNTKTVVVTEATLTQLLAAGRVVVSIAPVWLHKSAQTALQDAIKEAEQALEVVPSVPAFDYAAIELATASEAPAPIYCRFDTIAECIRHAHRFGHPP